MALPALTQYERLMYKDQMTVYREVLSADGNTAGYAIAAISGSDSTLLQNIPCNFHRTPNFDKAVSPAGMSKETNIFTSNEIQCQYAVTVQDQDVLSVTTRFGDSEWQKVDGAPERPVLMPHTHVYGVPVKAPTIVSP